MGDGMWSEGSLGQKRRASREKEMQGSGRRGVLELVPCGEAPAGTRGGEGHGVDVPGPFHWGIIAAA